MNDRLVARLPGVKSLVVIAAALIAVGPAAGQAADSCNAAAWYERSFARLGSIEITEDEWKAIREYQGNPHAAPTETLRAVLRRVEPVLSAARRGAQEDYSDFELDYAQGYELLLPHLSQLRNVGGLMAADAKLRLQDGGAAAAADQIASMYRMSNHLGADAVMISSLVGQAIFEAADRVTAFGVDRGAFGPAESGALRDALMQFASDDPFAMIGAIEMERVITVDWLRERYAEVEDRASLLEDWIDDPGPEEALAGLALMDPAQFDAALDGADRTLGRVIEAFKMDDPDAARLALERITAEIESGEEGPLAAFMPYFPRLYERLLEGRTRIAERAAQLDALIAGTVDPDELANAAVLYLQAIEMIGQVEPQRLEPLREVAGSPMQPLDETRTETLRGAADIVETLRRAARIPRCDFSIVHGKHPPVIPGYLAGLRQAGWLLLADAVRMLQEAQDDQAADRLRVCFRMSAHLAGDAIITSSLVSHSVFGDADGLARWALGNDAFSADDRARLFGGVEAMPRRDPFGYVSAVMSAREQIMKQRRLGGDAGARAEQVLRRLDGDQLLYLLVVIDEQAAGSGSREQEADQEQEREQKQLADLGDVISPEGLAAARGRADQASKVIQETADFAAAVEQDVPLIGDVKRRQASARADLRRAYFALEPPAEPK